MKFWGQTLEGKTTTLMFSNQKLEGKTTTPKNCVLTSFLHERSRIFFPVFSLVRFWILLRNANLVTSFFVKPQHSYLDFPHLTIFYFGKWLWLLYEFLWKRSIAIYGAKMRGSVFKIVFRVLAREFESIETYPGFAQLLGENWV